jgi:hypothetical protein
MQRKEISAGAKLCYGRLARFAGKDGSCYPKRETLANAIGVSQRQVDRYINELKKYNLIGVGQTGKKRPNEYFFYESEWMIGKYKGSTHMSTQNNSESTDMSTSESTDMSTSESTDMSTPYIRESFEDSHNKESRGKQVYPPPTFDQVKDYFTSKGYGLEVAKKFYEYYNEPMIDRNGRVWKDANGKTVRSWKQKALSVWMKDKPQTTKGDTWNTQLK